MTLRDIDRVTYAIDEHLHCRREDLVFFPDQISGSFHWRDNRPHAETAVSRCIDQFIKAEGVAKAVFHKQGCIVYQVVCSNDIERG